MPHPEFKSTPTFSDFPLFLGYWAPPFFIFRTTVCKKSSIDFDMVLLETGPGHLVCRKIVAVEIYFGNSKKIAPEHFYAPAKIFEANFGGFAGILALWSKLQKVIILGALRDSFEILGKSLTLFQILEKPLFAP